MMSNYYYTVKLRNYLLVMVFKILTILGLGYEYKITRYKWEESEDEAFSLGYFWLTPMQKIIFINKIIKFLQFLGFYRGRETVILRLKRRKYKKHSLCWIDSRTVYFIKRALQFSAISYLMAEEDLLKTVDQLIVFWFENIPILF